ncbi:acyltransferase family protein [Streptomyces sp. URMC 125]|uniref:acyltransferase family protein n=1 Tax=Streptomyces sp. URMC 125 TaxID=3423419 RepID=UPI003F1BCA45
MSANSLTDTRTGGQKRIPKFEGLRGFLAFGVVVYHVAFQAGVSSFVDQPGKGFWGVLADGLGVCLPPFFVLSGLMLYRPYARVTLQGASRPATGPFLKRRALRILPAYWALVVFAMVGFNYNELNGVGDFLRPLLLVHFFWYEDQPLHGIEPTWTVPTEFAFYLALPVLAWIGHRLARGARSTGAKARRLLIPLVVLELIGLAWIIYTNLPSTGATMQWYWPPYYVGYFAGGMALAVFIAYAETAPRTPVFHRLVLRRPLACWTLAVGVYALYAAKLIGTPGMGDTAALVQEVVDHFLVFAFALLIIAPMTVPGVRSRFMDGLLTNRPMLFLGKISFGVYLWHEIVINVWLKNGSMFGASPVPTPQFRGHMGFWELLVFTMAITVVIATASYYLLERPIMRLGRPSRTAPGTVPAQYVPDESAAAPAQYRPVGPGVHTADRG